MTPLHSLHEKALILSKTFRETEGQLLSVLVELVRKRGFTFLGYPDCFTYCLKALKLSEAQASYFSRVSRKSLEVPALQAAITQGKLSLSQARRIEPVITRCNSGDWIEKAATLPQRELERKVAEANPRAHVVERIRPVALDRSEMKVAISTALETKLGRVRDVLSTKRRRPVSLEEALEAMTETYLDREDPVRRAARARASSGNAKPAITRRIPARDVHAVNLRDEGRCAHLLPDGTRCGSARWTELHHLEPWGQGGKHSPDNLLTLCAGHHRALHGDGKKSTAFA